jgi:hypothetical protein
MSSGDDDDMTADELALLAADQAGRMLSELPRPSLLLTQEETRSDAADVDLAACEEEDGALRQRTAQALERLQADRADVRSLLAQTKRTEDDLDDWRERRHALLQDGLREALASLGGASGSEDDDSPLREAPSELVTGFAAGLLSAGGHGHACTSQARRSFSQTGGPSASAELPSWSPIAESGSSSTDAERPAAATGNPSAENKADTGTSAMATSRRSPGAACPAVVPGAASDSSLQGLLAGGDARLEAHINGTRSRPGSRASRNDGAPSAGAGGDASLGENYNCACSYNSSTSGRPGSGGPGSGGAWLAGAGGDARSDIHNSCSSISNSTSGRPGSGRPGSGGAGSVGSRPSTAQQHRLAFEARESLVANLAEKDAARQVNHDCICPVRTLFLPRRTYAPADLLADLPPNLFTYLTPTSSWPTWQTRTRRDR